MPLSLNYKYEILAKTNPRPSALVEYPPASHLPKPTAVACIHITFTRGKPIKITSTRFTRKVIIERCLESEKNLPTVPAGKVLKQQDPLRQHPLTQRAQVAYTSR